MDRVRHVRTLQQVRVFVVEFEGCERLGVMLGALGADVRVFASLHQAHEAAVPTGMTVLVVRLALDDVEYHVHPVTLVVRGFGVWGVLRREPFTPSFEDTFVEAHRGDPDLPRLCTSVLRAAGISRAPVLRQPVNGRGVRLAS